SCRRLDVVESGRKINEADIHLGIFIRDDATKRQKCLRSLAAVRWPAHDQPDAWLDLGGTGSLKHRARGHHRGAQSLDRFLAALASDANDVSWHRLGVYRDLRVQEGSAESFEQFCQKLG